MTVLSQQQGHINQAERDRTLNMLRGCKLPVWNPVMTQKLFMEAVGERVRNSMGQRFPLPVGIGEARIFNDISDADLLRGFQAWEELCSPLGTSPSMSQAKISHMPSTP